jgi:hypothetical protein
VDVADLPADPQSTESVQREGLLDHPAVRAKAGSFCPFHTGILNHSVITTIPRSFC